MHFDNISNIIPFQTRLLAYLSSRHILALQQVHIWNHDKLHNRRVSEEWYILKSPLNKCNTFKLYIYTLTYGRFGCMSFRVSSFIWNQNCTRPVSLIIAQIWNRLINNALRHLFFAFTGFYKSKTAPAQNTFLCLNCLCFMCF